MDDSRLPATSLTAAAPGPPGPVVESPARGRWAPVRFSEASSRTGPAAARLPANVPPTLSVIVDTEEEFDWSLPFSHAHATVTASAGVHAFQRLLSRYGFVVTYLVTHPVASDPRFAAVLREYHRSGACAIGAHLHPWVTPPMTESISQPNSYACNLPIALQELKVRALVRTLEDAFGLTPRLFKAGRYGVGDSTATVLERLGFEMDVSLNPGWDYSADGGPDFTRARQAPFWFGESRPLLEIPSSSGCTGVLGDRGLPLRRRCEKRPWSAIKLPGVLARVGLVDFVQLSPEGNTLDEMKRLARALLGRGTRTLTMTLHSPSLEAGHTTYVRTGADLQAFSDRMAGFLEFFLGDIGGIAETPEGVWARLVAVSAAGNEASGPNGGVA